MASSPSSTQTQSLKRGFTSPTPEAPKESALVRYLITPLTFISFLLSLFLIDTAHTTQRTHIHSLPRPPPSSSLYGRAKALFHRCVYRPQPYEYVQSPNGSGGGRAGTAEKQKWYWHTKQRKMMRMEVVEAFEMRRWVVVVLMGGLAVVGSVAVWGVRWALLWAWSGARV